MKLNLNSLIGWTFNRHIDVLFVLQYNMDRLLNKKLINVKILTT